MGKTGSSDGGEVTFLDSWSFILWKGSELMSATHRKRFDGGEVVRQSLIPHWLFLSAKIYALDVL